MPPRLASWPARIGALFASPSRALAEIDARGGGGVRDALWLVVLATVCLRLEDLARAVIGAGSVIGVTRQVLTVLGQELRGAVFLAIASGVAITALAGRGRRDPSSDIELGAAAVVPGLAASWLFRFVGLPDLAALSVEIAWAAAMTFVALRVARRRPTALEAPLATTPRRDRFAAASLAALLGGALFLNAGLVARQARSAPA